LRSKDKLIAYHHLNGPLEWNYTDRTSANGDAFLNKLPAMPMSIQLENKRRRLVTHRRQWIADDDDDD